MRQESPLDLIFTHTLSLHKADGRVFQNIRSRVADNKIILADGLLPIEVGDWLTRELPNGMQDRYVIDDYAYQEAIAGLPNRFHLTVHRESTGSPFLSTASTHNASSGGGQKLHQHPSQLLSVVPQPDGPAKAKPGPKPNLRLAGGVLEIVERVAGIGPWKDRLDEICDALDEARIPNPKTWKRRGIESWADAAALERELAKKAIEHHVALARG